MEIDKFKSTISKRGGLAPQNRFAVYMAIPLISFDPQDLIAKVFNQGDRKSTRLNSSHSQQSRMPSSA